ncbi:c-type cytochrome [Chloroflexota bacterium]
MKNKLSVLFVIILALTVVLTACGGGGGGSTDDTASAGEKLFNQTVIGAQAGCVTCHSLDAGVVIVGPSMDGVGGRAGNTVSGMSAEDYLEESILNPEAYLVEGFPSGTMPQVWEDELSNEQVDQLIAFMATLK